MPADNNRSRYTEEITIHITRQEETIAGADHPSSPAALDSITNNDILALALKGKVDPIPAKKSFWFRLKEWVISNAIWISIRSLFDF